MQCLAKSSPVHFAASYEVDTERGQAALSIKVFDSCVGLEGRVGIQEHFFEERLRRKLVQTYREQ